MNRRTIINAMFAKGLGGIEQAFIDYTEALLSHGNQIFCLVHKGAEIIRELQNFRTSELQIIEIKQYGKWDIFANLHLSKLVRDIKPDAAIAHGNRPTSLLYSACKNNKIPLVSVAHNYKIKPLLQSDYIFSITTHLKEFICNRGFNGEKIFVIPNMLKLSTINYQPSTINHQPTIGVMARFVKKKGVDVFIKACGALKDKGYKFNAMIGGNGEERESLQKLRDELKLNDIVRFTGWVKDKNAFYDSIDIFCLPSHHEPFGIVLLEAMSHKKPIVTTDSEGPLAICENGKDCLMVEKDHPAKLAIALAELLDNPEKAKILAENGYGKLINNYTLEKVAEELNDTLKMIIK